MNTLADLAAPAIICAVCICGLIKGTDVFSALLKGAGDGLKVVYGILPALLILFPAIYMLRASGIVDALTALIAPVIEWLGIPAETTGLMLLRPFTGGGAMAAAGDIMSRCGPDTNIGRTAAVMLGSSETTFYVISVYFGAAGISRSRWAVPAAVAADLACFISAAWAVKLIWG